MLSSGAMSVRQREFWHDGPPEELQVMFEMTKANGAAARCVLWSHQFGWELRLTVNGSLIRSQVCRAYADIAVASEECARLCSSGAGK